MEIKTDVFLVDRPCGRCEGAGGACSLDSYASPEGHRLTPVCSDACAGARGRCLGCSPSGARLRVSVMPFCLRSARTSACLSVFLSSPPDRVPVEKTVLTRSLWCAFPVINKWVPTHPIKRGVKVRCGPRLCNPADRPPGSLPSAPQEAALRSGVTCCGPSTPVSCYRPVITHIIMSHCS